MVDKEVNKELCPTASIKYRAVLWFGSVCSSQLFSFRRNGKLSEKPYISCLQTVVAHAEQVKTQILTTMKYLIFLLLGLSLIGCNDDNYDRQKHKIDTDFNVSIKETNDSLSLVIISEEVYNGANYANYEIEYLDDNLIFLEITSLHLCSICQRIQWPTYNEIYIGTKSIDKYNIDIKVKRKTQRVTYENGQLSIDKKGSIKIENE
jgi:hypothetical protein